MSSISAIFHKPRQVVKRLLYKYMTAHLGQAGQDFWVIEGFNEMRRGYFVDVGAHDGISFSNTYLLEKKYQWTGICVEAHPHLFSKLKAERNCICSETAVDHGFGEIEFRLDDVYSGIISEDVTAHSFTNKDADKITVKTKPLKDILDEGGAPNIIQFLSMDVEGAEERILKDFPFGEYTFLMITLERPGERLTSLLLNNGYTICKVVPGLDTLFVHESYIEDYSKSIFRYYARKRWSFRWR